MELNYSYIFLVPMSAKLGGIFLFWLYYRFHKSNNPMPHKPNIYRCMSCKYVYIDERKVPLSRCAKCGKLNEAVRR